MLKYVAVAAKLHNMSDCKVSDALCSDGRILHWNALHACGQELSSVMPWYLCVLLGHV